MGRGKALSDFEKSQIRAFATSGYRYNKISVLVKRSRHVVENFLEDEQNYGKQKSPGPPSKVSKLQKRRIVMTASNSTSSENKIKDSLGSLDASKMTVWCVIDKNPKIVRGKMAVQRNLKDVHKQSCLSFARSHMAWTHEWENKSGRQRHYVKRSSRCGSTTFVNGQRCFLCPASECSQSGCGGSPR